MSSAAIHEPAATRADDAWSRAATLLGCVAAVILALFWSDAADMAGIWWNSSTYTHCILILPIIAWLVAQRWPELRKLEPVAWAPGLLVVGAGAAAWLLGYAGGIALGRHLGLVLMLQGAVIACLGKAVARGLMFPLFFAFFLIPFGDELVPPMQTVTAQIAMALLNLSGVPAHLEGVFITTPAGYFEVAEACAGVKFLVAMAALAALVANLCFTATRRRTLFVIFAMVVPVLANGVRAFATVRMAEETGVDAAAGYDHVIYGGIFFAVVIALVLGAAWRFFDRKVGDPWFDPARLQPQAIAADPPGRGWRLAGAVLAIALAPIGWSAVIAATGRQEAPADLALPEVPGWTRVEASAGRPWQPHFAGADLIRTGRYRNAAGQEVDLAIAVFARQEEGRELVGFGQGAVGPESDWAWTGNAAPPPGGRAERITSHGDLREVVSFYRVGDRLTGSAMAVKLETMKVRLLGGPQRAVAVLVSAPVTVAGVSPRPAIDAFLAALGPVEALADRAAGGSE